MKQGVVQIHLSKETVKGIKMKMRETSTTMFMNALAVLNIVLFQYSNERDIIVGTAVGNKTNVEVQELIGFFLNTIA